MVNSGELIQLVRATGELYGKTVSDVAAVMFLADLSGHDGEQIKHALSRCRKELRTFPTVSDVISRIPDGRPGVEEAWALIPKDEHSSVVWNDEISEAYGVCRLLIADDPVAARMAFKEAYTKITAEARAVGRKPVWSPSFGFEKSGRAAAIDEAVQRGRITHDNAISMLPDYSEKPGSLKKLGFNNPIPEMPK